MNLEERLELLEREVSALRARAALEEVMGRYQQMVSCGKLAEIPAALYAKRAEDACVEFGASGPYTGYKKLSTYYEKDVIPGQFTIAALASPQITVEGETAHGCWTVIGTELDAGDLGENPPKTMEERMLLTIRAEDGKAYRADWVWQRYDVRFIVEDGAWRIHKLRIFDLLRCPFDRDFVRYAAERWATDGVRLDLLFTSNIPFAPGELPENLASGATTRHWQYTPDAEPPAF